MTILQARHEADGADFLDGTPKRLLPDLYYLGDFQGNAVYAFFASSKWFLVNAPGGPGLVRFVRTVSGTGARTTGADGGLAHVDRRGRDGRPPGPWSHPAIRRSSWLPPGLGDLGGRVRLGPPSSPPRNCRPAAGSRSGRSRSAGAGPHRWPTGSAGPARPSCSPGAIPIKANGHTDAVLFTRLATSRDLTLDYLASAYRLGDLKPDLWLPARRGWPEREPL